MEPVTIIAAINGFVELGNKLMDRFPEYKQRIEKDWNDSIKAFDSYKRLPREKRVTRYLFNLKQEIENHLIVAKEYIK